MFKFAFKNMLVKRVKILLVIFSIVLSASVGILAYNVSAQVEEGIVNTTAYYDTIIGPAGSDTDLAMTTMFFTDGITDTISYEYYEQLKSDMRVNVAVPFAMGDAYNGSKIIGTSADFFGNQEEIAKKLKKGEMFDEKMEAVVGYSVAKQNGLEIGDELVTSHGISGAGHEHSATPLVVVGILDKTNTAYDGVVFTQLETIWTIHSHGGEGSSDEEHVIEGEHAGEGHSATTDGSHMGEEHGTAGEEAHEEHSDHQHEICAVLIKCKTPGQVTAVQNEYKSNSELLVITPSEVMREVLSNVDTSVYIVYVLCVIILIMNICIISVITLLNMYDSRKEISLMRLIGIGMNKINALYIIQNGIIGFISTLLAFGVSRLCLLLARGYVSSMGIVLNVAKIYPIEFAIMALVFVISVLPTVICTVNMSKKDGISE